MARERAVLAAEIVPAEAEHLVRCLVRLGHPVRLATTGAEALALLRREIFDQAVVAAGLKLDGLPLLAWLSRLPAPGWIVAIGPAGDVDAEVRARSFGAAAYLTRPVSTEALAVALRLPIRGPP